MLRQRSLCASVHRRTVLAIETNTQQVGPTTDWAVLYVFLHFASVLVDGNHDLLSTRLAHVARLVVKIGIELVREVFVCFKHQLSVIGKPLVEGGPSSLDLHRRRMPSRGPCERDRWADTGQRRPASTSLSTTNLTKIPANRATWHLGRIRIPE